MQCQRGTASCTGPFCYGTKMLKLRPVELTYTASFDGVQPFTKVNEIADTVAAGRAETSSANPFDFDTYVRHP